MKNQKIINRLYLKLDIMKISKIKFSFIFVLFATTAIAQTPTTKDIGNEDITIVKEYQPVLNDAFKINIPLEGDTATTTPVVLKYTIDPRPMNSNYNLSPIKPVKIKDDNIKKLYRGFIKAGYGMENMPMLDVYFNSLRSKNFDLGFRYQHLSSTGKINDYGDPNNSSNTALLEGTRYFQKLSIKGAIDYDRRVVHYYGYNPSNTDLYSKSETEHKMDVIGADVKFTNAPSETNWKLLGGLNFYSFKDNRNSKENNFGVKLAGGRALEDGFIYIDGDFDFMGVEQDSLNYNRSYIHIRPVYTITKDLFSFQVGGNVTLEGNDGETDYHLHPIIKGSYEVIDNTITVFGEFSGDMERNDIRKFSKENPFWLGNISLKNTNTKINIKAGTAIKINNQLMLNASGAFMSLTDMAFFINPPANDFPTTYTVTYDNANLLQFKASADYKLNEKITAGANLEFNNYNTKNLEKALYIPTLVMGINGVYNISDKIYAKLDFIINTGATGIKYDNGIDAEYFTLKNYFDANLTIDYRYTKLLSLFASLNNIGFSQYFHYYQYPSYRFNAMIGGTLSF